MANLAFAQPPCLPTGALEPWAYLRLDLAKLN
jgi:hypothetical protein